MDLSSFGLGAIKTYTSSHKNRARDIIRKFDKTNQEIRGFSESIIQEVCELSSKEICKRLNFREEVFLFLKVQLVDIFRP